MSAPPDSGAPRCACTNISLMQLFHELKQKFPAAPDHAVSAAISAYCHDKRACEDHLERQAAASLAHAYHASSSAAARRLKDLSANIAPLECRNRLVRQQVPAPSSVRELTCDKAQNAELSSNVAIDDNCNIDLIGALNQIHVGNKVEQITTAHNESIDNGTQNVEKSPIIINIDNCVEKSGETSSDVETEEIAEKYESNDDECKTNESTESSNYRILKSHKIKNNLNVRLEKTKESKTPAKPIPGETTDAEINTILNSEKPKRPCTLEFNKPQSEQNTSQAPAPESVEIVSPAHRQNQPKEQSIGPWPEQYPLNVSVNVNCHMDIANRPQVFCSNPWLDDYESPRAFTSVNLTVCTPTSGGMPSPGRDSGGEGRGFEGHLTVTVSPSSSRPRRVAPPPPHTPLVSPQMHVATPTHQRTTVPENSLVARQLARKKLLEDELARERERLSRVAHEASILAAPPAPPAVARRLREQVEWLRQQCQAMTRQLDINNAAQHIEREELSGAYPGMRARASPTPARPAPPPPEEAPSWQCQICTFSNHGLLNKCEQCEMPRILVGTNPRPVTHEAKLDNSVLLGSSNPNSAKPACV